MQFFVMWTASVEGCSAAELSGLGYSLVFLLLYGFQVKTKLIVSKVELIGPEGQELEFDAADGTYTGRGHTAAELEHVLLVQVGCCPAPATDGSFF
ncbi:hypothetical protein GW17_00046693 [Ensete ventricosum]|nr:hypothetical protein GW17_00046693 [Ensete ventricosum]